MRVVHYYHQEQQSIGFLVGTTGNAATKFIYGDLRLTVNYSSSLCLDL